jgi:hypothetical protein
MFREPKIKYTKSKFHVYTPALALIRTRIIKQRKLTYTRSLSYPKYVQRYTNCHFNVPYYSHYVHREKLDAGVMAVITKRPRFRWWIMFVCMFIAAWAIFQLSGGCHHYRWQDCKFRPILSAQGLLAVRDLFRATPTATQDLGLYGLIRWTDTHVPQWDSNQGHKDHQIFAHPL